MLLINLMFFFFNDTATTEIYTLSLHDALPISMAGPWLSPQVVTRNSVPKLFIVSGLGLEVRQHLGDRSGCVGRQHRSEEHTSELQSRQYLVCRLLLEKKKKNHSSSRLYISNSR